MSHPLDGDSKWKFWKPTVTVKTTFLLLGKGDKKSVPSHISRSGCREGILSNMKTRLREAVMKKKKVTTNKDGWETATFTREKRLRLFDRELIASLPGGNQIRIRDTGLKPKGLPESKLKPQIVEEFILVADALVGIPSVLLSHHRPEGEWWRTDHLTCINKDGEVEWNGSDNWFLRHPILLSIVTGLYRQAAMLTACGYGPKVLDCVKRGEVEDALTTGDWRLAFGIAKQLRPWIEVPVGAGGSEGNFPFSIGEWDNFDRLQRAQRRYNYLKVFGTSFYDSWGLNPGNEGGAWSGTQTYWGFGGGENENHQHLMNLGEPRRRAKGGKDS